MSDHINVPQLFGSLVFNRETMARRLSQTCYHAWERCLAAGTTLPLSVADEMANAMKDWAIEHGATHYTHWFQPMTGFTAEKHDSFITPTGDGKALMHFSGKELVRGEPDASSFPSGGLRATFEARGYTAWDPTSFAFLKDGSLCIPTIFCSYSGQALDKKTPLLRSCKALSEQAVRIVRLFGLEDVKKVIPQVGPEQEYFLVDRKVYEQREDLMLCGRTLFGARAPKGQEMDDHYYGTIKPRIAAYMSDLDRELWQLGVSAKTKHNEVAPAQHELAPIYSDVNTACDHNQLTMELMKKVAARHGMVCLLHEKPFAGVNGSGKHNNWSLSTDTGKNLFKPGSTPSQNARFLLFLTAFLKGVDEYQELLRSTVANAGNDHRLGANEAPPAVISVFLGDELTAIVDSIVNGTPYQEQSDRTLQIGVDVLPAIPQDTTDRNRTSPLAFTGNKFEFRMLGSSQSISGPNIALNTIMAEELRKFADELEQAKDFNAALSQLIRRELKAHQRIIFNGNNYSGEWLEEATRRGLANHTSTADALPHYVSEENLALLERHKVLTRQENLARHEIHMENYIKILHIEALTMLHMIRRKVYPAACRSMRELAETINAKRTAMAGIDCSYEENALRRMSILSTKLMDGCEELDSAVENMPTGAIDETVRYYHDTILAAMARTRDAADRLEAIIPADNWPYPSYRQLLFSI